MVASTDPAAKSHLRLPGSEEVLNRVEFSHRLADTIRTSLDLGFVTDDLILVQVSSLMALYIEGPTGSTTSARYCSEAVHHAQNIGLHLTRPTSPSRHTFDQLFSCVWAIDRLNAAFNGRPVLMHNRDLGVNLDEIIHTSQPAFRLFLKICTLLDQVISLYRPQNRSQDDPANEDHPTFEEVVMSCEAAEVDANLLGETILLLSVCSYLLQHPSHHCAYFYSIVRS